MAGMVAVGERTTTTSLEQCRAALSRGDVLFVCVARDGGDPERALAGVRDLQADSRFPSSAAVSFDAWDPAGPILLRELGVPDDGGTSVVMLAPPGSVVAYYAAAPTKEELITSWMAAFGG
ncbi:MAG TPA: hypothetical protein VIU29_03405 [Candidatus Deferrimicrobiaceae bacterium]|nr:hypothetical protein [Anaeromyxobacteraceae bacterium]